MYGIIAQVLFWLGIGLTLVNFGVNYLTGATLKQESGAVALCLFVGAIAAKMLV